MAPRVIVHAGFHKTGTSSAQEVLQTARTTLAPDVTVTLRADMVALCESARAYSADPGPAALGFVQYEAACLAEAWDAAGTYLLSSEDLSGHMPGRRGLRDYGAAPALARAMTEAWRTLWPAADITLAYTTRAAKPWLASCYVQHLRATRITLDPQTYHDTYAGSANLAGVIASVAKAVPDAAVVPLALEEVGPDRLGPAGALLALAGVRDARRAPLPPARHVNVGLSLAGQRQFLAWNRSDRSDAEVRRLKTAFRDTTLFT